MGIDRKMIAGIFVLLTAVFALSILFLPNSREVMTSIVSSEPILILDAGHGGVDGGAVSASGIVESELNLEITKRLALVMVFCGQRIALTRINSDDLSSSDAATIREKKASDLKNRVVAINSVSNAVLISIHQNSIPDYPSVHGAQVFYNTHTGSNALATAIQESLNQVRNVGNEKQCKAIDSGIYLMREVLCSAVLIECGFLSNSAEANELCTSDCQKQLAMVITAGYLTYTREGML